MADEEFQESEVIFQVEDSNYDGGDFPVSSGRGSINCRGKRRKLIGNNKKNNNSIPIDIPENVSRNAWLRYVADSDFGGGDGGEMVPPHVVIGRRVAGKVMAFSLCTGNGRTLKGRDLSEFRNSILRMTGFLET